MIVYFDIGQSDWRCETSYINDRFRTLTHQENSGIVGAQAGGRVDSATCLLPLLNLRVYNAVR